MIQAGVDVFRLNYSHGTHESHAAAIQLVRQASEQEEREVGVLQDLSGPKIRTGGLEGDPLRIPTGAEMLLSPGTADITPEVLTSNLPTLIEDLKEGDRVLLRDGRLELEAVERQGESFRMKVNRGGKLTGKAGINLPDTEISVPSFTEKDRADLEHGLEIGVDIVALSFVRRADDLLEVRKAAGERDIFLVAKIEKPEAIGNLEGILAHSDGVMVARGDLGVEVPAEQVPRLQKRIIREANRLRIPVITATQMLESMIDNPVPTRAEASDVANAIFDGTDALMLSGETAAGSFPVAAVSTMARIARSSDEPDDESQRRFRTSGRTLQPPEAVARVASRAAEDVRARAIVVYTESGSTARLIAAQRPSVPILALTPHIATARRLRLCWGVYPRQFPNVTRLVEMLEIGEKILVDANQVQEGDRVVVVSGSRAANKGGTNMMKVHTIGETW